MGHLGPPCVFAGPHRVPRVPVPMCHPYGPPSAPMCPHEPPSVLMGIVGPHWVPMNPWVPWGRHGSPWVPICHHSFPMGPVGPQVDFMGLHGCPSLPCLPTTTSPPFSVAVGCKKFPPMPSLFPLGSFGSSQFLQALFGMAHAVALSACPVLCVH